MPHRVLLVDDSQATRAFVEAALDAGGDFEITDVDSGYGALKALPAGNYDLVITDINMPDINGLDVIRFARTHARYRDTPVIAISTEGRELDRDRALALGANAYLVKPFTADDLLSTLRRVLPRRE